MAKKNELPALIASLFLTVALLGAGAWWLRSRLFAEGGGSVTGQTSDQTAGQVSGGAASGRSLQGSVGGADGTAGRSVLPIAASAVKQKGLDALAAGDYDTAKVEFTTALAENRNDPESLIYLNNAEIGDAPAYTIAVVVPAGSAVSAAEEIMRGAAQAQADINGVGGISGTPLKLLLINDNDEVDEARAVADALVKAPDVLGVVGHFSSGTTLAVSEIYEAGALPMISPTSTAVRIADAGDYIFRTVPSDRLAAATLSRYVLNELEKQSAAVFHTSESAYSQSVKSEFTTELLSNGGEVVADFDVSEPGFSAGRAVQSAKESGADVIMLALNTATIDAANQIIAVNQRSLPMVGGDSLYNPKVLDVGRANAQGLTVAVPWHILSHEQSPFVSESRRLWGGDVNWRTATAYDAVQALAAGLTQQPNREGLASALAASGLSIEGATDPIRFLPTGDRNQPSQLVEVVPGPRSGSGFDYVPVQ
ncbi:MAG: ABC transporter substrate-binding protein [Cyanobacteria bacterium J06623_5]